MLTQRLGSTTQKNEVFVDALIQQIQLHPGSVDEVWLATDYGFPTLETHRQSAQQLVRTAEKFRKIGVRVSLQLSNSIGHGEYMSARDCTGLLYPGSSIEKMVGHDGTVADYCFCWNGRHLREYVKQELTEYVSRLKPYCVWIDDDLRASNHAPVSLGCFCDDCMQKFNRKYHADFTRETLVQEIVSGDPAWRENHIEFLREGLADFTYELGSVIHAASPDTRMGYQYCANGGYTGFGYDFIFDAMRRATHHDPCSRPGGGHYNDHVPAGFIDKGELLDYQNYMLPDYVREIRPEIESLPDIVYGKSIGGTCFETSYYMASGANAMSYAILMNNYEPMSWHGKMLAAFAEHRHFWEMLCQTSQNTFPSGLRLAFPEKGYLRHADSVQAYSREYYQELRPLRFVNIPIAFSRDASLCAYLSLHNVEAMCDREIGLWMTKPVLTTAEVVSYLTDRGFTFPCTAKRIDTLKLYEAFTDHPVNDVTEPGTARFWHGQFGQSDGFALFGSESFAPLGLYATDSNAFIPQGAASSAILTLETGAKWAVFGLDFPQRTLSSAKVRQIIKAAEYITGHGFAAELLTPIQGVLQPRVNAAGKTVRVCFTNCTVGDSGEMELLVRNPASDRFLVMGQYEKEYTPEVRQLSESAYIVKLRNVKAYTVCGVFCV